MERSTFTIEDARQAKLVKPDGGWATYPKAMLLARATSQLCRSLFADVISGISYTPEELYSIEEPTPAVDVTSNQGTRVVPRNITQQHALLAACGGDADLARSIWGDHPKAEAFDEHTFADLLDKATAATQSDDVVEAEVVANPITADQIKRIHVLKGSLGMTEPDYRARLKRLGVSSSKELTQDQAAALISTLSADGGKYEPFATTEDEVA